MKFISQQEYDCHGLGHCQLSGRPARGWLATAGVLLLVGTILFSGCLAAFAVSGRKQSSLGSHRWGALCCSPTGSASSVLDSGSNEKCFAILSKASTLLTRIFAIVDAIGYNRSVWCD